MKRIPYGISDFGELRRSNCYYVDKTRYIAMVEDDMHFVHFVRPRRFGKSLFLSMLEVYYDVERRAEADELFRGTWIAEHPTPLKNSFLVLRMDFSQVVGGLGKLRERFDEYCKTELEFFTDKYEAYFSEDQLSHIRTSTSAEEMMTRMTTAASANGLSLYLLLDECDDFINAAFNKCGQEVISTMAQIGGLYRDFLKIFRGNFTRIFMTGVTPVTLNEQTDGPNIATNISTASQYNAMLGLSESEVREMLDYFHGEGVISQTADEILPLIRPWFGNYCFAPQCSDISGGVYNTCLMLNFVRHYMAEKHIPHNLIDSNVRISLSKFRKIVDLDEFGGDREGDILSIVGKKRIDAKLSSGFQAEDMLRPEYFTSLLYYFGLLTIGGCGNDDMRLIIPNHTARSQFYSVLTELTAADANIDTLRAHEIIHGMATTGDARPFLDYALPGYARTCGVHSSIERERGLQSFLSAYLSLATYYNIRQEYELGGGYCDIIAYPSEPFRGQVDHAFIFELKSLRASDSQADADRQWEEAETQLRHYATDAAIPSLMAGARLHLIRFQAKDGQVVRFEEVEP